MLDAFDGALYPLDITCDACGNELVEDTRYRLCSECMEKLPFAKGHICLNCGVPLEDESDYCNRCQNQKSSFVKNRSPLVYDGEVKRLIYKLKFGKRRISLKRSAHSWRTSISNAVWTLRLSRSYR